MDAAADEEEGWQAKEAGGWRLNGEQMGES
jgi:hypothetical protein